MTQRVATPTRLPGGVSAGPRGSSAHRGGRACSRCSDLRTSFNTRWQGGAVTGVDFTLRKGEILGLVGESGCGKSVTSLSVLGLIQKPGTIERGESCSTARTCSGARRTGCASCVATGSR